MAKGEAIRSTPTAELMAEVHAMLATAATRPCHLSLQAQLPPLGLHQIPSMSTLQMSMSAENPANVMVDGKRTPYRGKKCRNGGNGDGNSSGGHRRASHDPNKYCTLHECVRHSNFECRKAKK